MRDIKVDEALWASSMLPEGIVERWFIANGAMISAGERIAEVRIEDALHEIVAPASGRATIVAAVNAVIEPGSILATLDDTTRHALILLRGSHSRATSTGTETISADRCPSVAILPGSRSHTALSSS